MANATPEYFIAPTWDFPPNGPIVLGSIISSLKTPHRRLALCLPGDNDVLSSSKTGVSLSKDKLSSGGVTVLTTFLAGLLGLGVDVGAEWKKSDAKSFTFDRIDTTHFIPTEEYVTRCIENKAVRRFLETSRYRKSVYIITGVKVVSGAKGATTKSRGTEGMLGVQADGTILSGGMVPVGGGPELSRGRETKAAVSWEGSTDFVLAYKLSEVRVRKSGELKQERDYLKGALLGDAPNEDEPEALAVEVVGNPEFVASSGFVLEDLVEDDEVVSYGVPNTESLRVDS
ncbi:hypothetical protein EK21DRAFT_117095 [Setomelanomma holmii]|uniref:Uncharacterized protein n=1 Tax=Setomelanomma holmii TaxID=210430 RepID=A0A9P4H054_9PLEO|nr:hypothetical protein EK21DRAFT_117095 [Setomelanomma holmii]